MTNKHTRKFNTNSFTALLLFGARVFLNINIKLFNIS